MSSKVIYENKFFSGLLYHIGRLFLRVNGWTVIGEFPKDAKMVAIAAPHTSNWDFPIFMAAVGYMRLHISFLGKHTLFKGPLGWLFYWLGGIPVDRANKTAGDLVDQAVEAFAERDQLILGIAPEGTRSKVEKWKTGFYRIAVKADVPILPAYLHAPSKTIGFGEPFYPSGNMEVDMARLQEFYADKKGIKPVNQ